MSRSDLKKRTGKTWTNQAQTTNKYIQDIILIGKQMNKYDTSYVLVIGTYSTWYKQILILGCGGLLFYLQLTSYISNTYYNAL